MQVEVKNILRWKLNFKPDLHKGLSSFQFRTTFESQIGKTDLYPEFLFVPLEVQSNPAFLIFTFSLNLLGLLHDS